MGEVRLPGALGLFLLDTSLWEEAGRNPGREQVERRGAAPALVELGLPEGRQW